MSGFPKGGGSTGGAVSSVNGQTGIVVLAPGDVGASANPHGDADHTPIYAYALAGARLVTGPTTYTPVVGDGLIAVDATAGAVTILLPAISTTTSPVAAGSVGKTYEVVKVDSSANAVSITTTGTDTVLGVTKLNEQGTQVVLTADTTSGAPYRWISGLKLTFSIGGTFLDPAGARNIMCWTAPFACTVTAVKAFAKGGTNAVINAWRNQASNFLSSNLTVGTMNTWTDGGAVQNTAIAVGDSIEIKLVSISGAITEVDIQVNLTRP